MSNNAYKRELVVRACKAGILDIASDLQRFKEEFTKDKRRTFWGRQLTIDEAWDLYHSVDEVATKWSAETIIGRMKRLQVAAEHAETVLFNLDTDDFYLISDYYQEQKDV